MTECNHKFNKGFCMLCDNCGLSMGYLLQKAEAENAKLRRELREAMEGFEMAGEGHGVNFFAYAADINKALLEGQVDEF